MSNAWKLCLVLVAALVTPSVGCAIEEEGEAVVSTDDALRNLEGEEAAFLDRINAYRAGLGLPRLVATRALTQAAFNHSADMANQNYFSHTGRDGSSHSQRMGREGYRCGYCGENLAAGNASADGAFDQWRNSPGHDRAMRDGRFRAIGIGRAHNAGSTYKWYWTTVFGDRVDGSGDARETGGPPPAPPIAPAAPRPDTALFDAVDYLSFYPDLQRAFGSDQNAATRHFWDNGRAEGRTASVVFSVRDYVGRYPDLQNAFGQNWPAAQNHWLSNGIQEGRVGSPVLDAPYYLSRYGDLQAAFGAQNYRAAIQHFLDHGIQEGRVGSPSFDAGYYLRTYPDVANACGGANQYRCGMRHYIAYGRGEGRRGAP